jgi:hypothetical protein
MTPFDPLQHLSPDYLASIAGGSARLDTDAGTFHVKAQPVDRWPGNVDQLRAAADIERAAIARGIPAAEPVVLAEVLHGHVVTVRRWVDGDTVTQHDVAAWAGRTLALLHTIPAPPPPEHDVWGDTFGAEGEWDEPLLHDLATLVRDAAADRPDVVGSHRDIHALNVIVDPSGAPHLVDWELAGRVRPWFEITRGAIDLGRNAAGVGTQRALAPDPATVQRVLRAYYDAGGERGPTDERALAGTFGIALARLRYERDDADFVATNIAKLHTRWADRGDVLAAIRTA